MKSAFCFGVSIVLLAGCASAPPTTSTPSTPPVASAPAEAPPAPPAEPEPEEPQQTAAEKWAERSSRAEAAASPRPSNAAAADPLAIGDELESATTTKVEITPARQIRTKTARDLMDGRKIAENAPTYEEAAQKLNVRLGKPTWVENDKKRVWVVRDNTQCYRLVLDVDGSVVTETVPLNETRMLSALSQQNACTGVVTNGIPGMKH
jgi:hypothetical protein